MKSLESASDSETANRPMKMLETAIDVNRLIVLTADPQPRSRGRASHDRSPIDCDCV